jgi:hypothetical protein
MESTAARSRDHVVTFYERDEELARTVAGFLVDGLLCGGAVIVIATEPHRRMFERELEAAGVEPGGGKVIALDAATTLGGLVTDGCVDRDAFRRVIGGVVREAMSLGTPVRAYGEMVALLWEAGDVMAAIAVEELWNGLSAELPFALLCGYGRSAVSSPALAEAVQRVCHLHDSVTVDLSRAFEPTLAAPRAARRSIADALRQAGQSPRMIDDAQTVVGELAANAVIHARSPFTLTASASPSSVHIAVRFRSPVAPTPRFTPSHIPGGKGLRVVAELSADWAVEFTDHGKVVWAELRAR